MRILHWAMLKQLRERKFCWWNGEPYPAFGKYRKKKNIKSILKNDRPYLEWVLAADFSEEVKTMIKKTLAGEGAQFRSNKGHH